MSYPRSRLHGPLTHDSADAELEGRSAVHTRQAIKIDVADRIRRYVRVSNVETTMIELRLDGALRRDARSGVDGLSGVVLEAGVVDQVDVLLPI